MIITVPDTTATGIHMALVEARHNIGVASSMVFTMIVIADARNYERALEACHDAGREHPSRIILVTNGDHDGNRLDAEIRLGEEVPGEIISLHFHGELNDHRASVVLALLLPDSPVVAWWPGAAPLVPGRDPIGLLAQRRITDAMGTPDPIPMLVERAHHGAPGDVDLVWTRLTRWRGLLAAAVEQYPSPIRRASVSATPGHAAADLLAAWLTSRTGIDTELIAAPGHYGIMGVELVTDAGSIKVSRTDGSMATFSAPGVPGRLLALPRRDLNMLITEELRRLDDDPAYSAAMTTLAARWDATSRVAVALP